MKRRLLLLLICSGVASVGLAGPEYLIKQRAKDLRDQNNARQGVPPPQAPQPPSQSQTAPAAPVRTVATPAQQSLARFNADLAGIKPRATLDEASKQKMTRDLLGAAEGKKPGTGTVDRFITSLHKALARKSPTPMARAKLVQDLDAILNPSKYPQAKPDAIFEDIRSILLGIGSPNVEASDIAATCRVMAAEVR